MRPSQLSEERTSGSGEECPMAIVVQDLEDFERFVLGRLRDEPSELSLEDYVCLWRAEREREDTIAAIQEGLDDLAAGRVRPAEDVLSELRQRLT